MPAARILQPPNREDVLPRQTALREAVGQSPGRCRGQPFRRTLETRTETRTALREDTRTAPRAKDRNYDLSTGLHTYGVIYPAGLRRPELVPTGNQTAFRLYEKTLFVGGRERDRRAWHVYESLRWFWGCLMHSYL